MKKLIVGCFCFCTTITFIPLHATSYQQVSNNKQEVSWEDACRNAQMGDAYSQAVASIYLAAGWRTEQDLAKAVDFAASSARSGNALGICQYGQLKRLGYGIKANEQEGSAMQKSVFEKLDAMVGNPYAIYFLGALLIEGKVVPQNIETGAKLLRMAAEKKFAPAQYNYALCLLNKIGAPLDEELAVSFISKAEDQGYSLQNNIGSPVASVARKDDCRREWANSLPLAVSKDVLNTSTMIWENSKNPTNSALWHKIGWSDSGNVEVSVRTQYEGYPVNHFRDRGEAVHEGGKTSTGINLTGVHNSTPVQSLWTVCQYIVNSISDKYLEFSPSMRLQDRNLLSITEYPLVLEVMISNSGENIVDCDSLNLSIEDVKEYAIPIVGLIPYPQGKSYLHNFGWGGNPNESYFLSLSEFGRGEALTGLSWNKYSEYTTIDVARHQLNAATNSQFDLNELFPEQDTKDLLAEFSDWENLALVATKIDSRKNEPLQERAFEIAPNEGLSHIRFPGDLTLPDQIKGYAISYPINQSIPPESSLRLRIALDATKSFQAHINPTFEVDKQNLKCKKLVVNFESVRSFAVQPAIEALPSKDNLYSPSFLEYQRDIMKAVSRNSTEWARLKIPSSISSPTINAAGFATIVPRMHVSQYHNVYRNLQPLVQTATSPVVHETPSTPLLGELDFKHCKKKVSFNGFRFGGNLAGDFVIRNSDSENIIFNSTFNFPKKVEGIQFECTAAMDGTWFAFTCAGGGVKRLYVAIPALADALFALPIDDDKIDEISVDKIENALLIKSSGKLYSFLFPRQLLQSLIGGINPRFLASGKIILKKNDVDADGRLRLMLTKQILESCRSEIQPARVTVDKISGPENVQDPVYGIAWANDFEILTLMKSNRLRRWNLQTGIISDCSMLEQQKLMNVVKNKGIRILPAVTKDELAMSLIGKIGNSKIYVRFNDFIFSDNHNHKSNRISVISISDTINYRSAALNNQENRISDIYLSGRRLQFGKTNTFARFAAISPAKEKIAFASSDGKSLYLFDVKKHECIMTAVASYADNGYFSLFTKTGEYLSGNGKAEGIVFSDGNQGIGISQLEAKYNRPDSVLKLLGAHENVILEANRLRARFLRRSDFKSFEGATLIDIPVVKITSDVPFNTGEKRASVDFDASSSTSPLKELRVFNNGALVKTLELKGKMAAGRIDIDLACDHNHLQLMAVSEKGFTSSFAEKQVNCTAESDSRQCFIVTVGVSEYKDSRFNLKFAAKDAVDVAGALKKSAESRGFTPKVLTLKNSDVDSETVAKIRVFLESATADDEVFLFFAGHGLLDKDLNYHYARNDTDFNANENIGIQFDEIESLVDCIKPLKRTVLLDTCHSGEVEEESKADVRTMVTGQKVDQSEASNVQSSKIATRGMKVNSIAPKVSHSELINLEKLFLDSRRAKGANILTSSSGSEFSMESDAWQNGLFTYVFLKALESEKSDLNGDKVLSFSELAIELQSKVKELSGGRQCPITRGVNRDAEVALASFCPPGQLPVIQKGPVNAPKPEFVGSNNETLAEAKTPTRSDKILSFEAAVAKADVGNAYAQAIVSIYYGLGFECEQDDSKSKEYVMLSAKQQNPLGIYRLAEMREVGQGMDQNTEQARQLMQKAKSGLQKLSADPYAMTALATIYERENPASTKARELLTKAAEMGYEPAQTKLSQINQ